MGLPDFADGCQAAETLFFMSLNAAFLFIVI